MLLFVLQFVVSEYILIFSIAKSTSQICLHSLYLPKAGPEWPSG